MTLRLHCLGGLSIVSPSGAVLGAATRRRPLALLAILASARSRGMSRDKLCAHLWPESDAEHARIVLRQTLYTLRRDLDQPELVAGTTEMRLNPEVIRSDVADFEDALDRGQLEEAALHYTGPFLDGFHLSRTAEFEHWAERERSRLERRNRGALEKLAADAERRGDREAAVAWWQRLAVLDPLSSRVTLAYMRALSVHGEHAGAIRQAHEHEVRLRDELAVSPDAAVSALASHLRASAPPAPPAPPAPLAPSPVEHVEVLGAKESAAVPAHSRPHESIGRAHESVQRASVIGLRFGRVRPMWLAVAGATLFLMNAGTGSQESATLSVPSKRTTIVAVLPFSVHGRAEIAYLGDGLVDLLARNLEGVDALQSVDSRVILSSVIADSAHRREPAGGAAIARRLGADRFVLGDVTEAQGRLRISASLYDRENTHQPLAQATAEGDASQLFSLVDQLTVAVLAALQRGSTGRLDRVAATTTSSLPAFKAYLAGEAEFRRQHWAAAVDAFERAVGMDSSFALAWYRLSIAADWASRADLAFVAAERASKRADRLSTHDRLLLDALRAWRRGAGDEAEESYRRVLDAHPDDVEAWYQLGEVLFHTNPSRGRSIAEARVAFDRVLALHPGDLEAIGHLGRIAGYEGKGSELAALNGAIKRAGHVYDGPANDSAAAYAYYALHDDVRRARIVTQLRSHDDASVYAEATRIAVYFHNLAAAEEIAALLTEPSRAPWARALGLSMLAELHLAQGRWKRARADLAAAAEFDPVRTAERTALLFTTPFAPATDRDVSDARRVLAQMDVGALPPHAFEHLAPFNAAHPYLRTYLSGALSIRLGDDTAVSRAADDLSRASGPDPDVAQLARALARSLRARLAWRDGRAATGLAELQASKLEISMPMLLSPFGSRSWERFARAELLYSLGRERESLGWYASMGQNSTYDLIFLVPALLREAEIYERLGNAAEATARYQRALALWRDCDDELRPLLDPARARVAAMLVSRP